MRLSVSLGTNGQERDFDGKVPPVNSHMRGSRPSVSYSLLFPERKKEVRRSATVRPTVPRHLDHCRESHRDRIAELEPSARGAFSFGSCEPWMTF